MSSWYTYEYNYSVIVDVLGNRKYNMLFFSFNGLNMKHESTNIFYNVYHLIVSIFVYVDKSLVIF